MVLQNSILGFITAFATIVTGYGSKTIPFSLSETRYKIAVVDTGIDFSNPKLAPFMCHGGHASFDGSPVFGKNNNGDTGEHGSNVSWRIVKDLDSKKVCLASIRYYKARSYVFYPLIRALQWVNSNNFSIMNLSSGGIGEQPVEKNAIYNMLNKGIIVVVAAGNNGNDLDKDCNYFPACYPKHKNFHVVGGLNIDQGRMYSSNYGKAITDWEIGVNQEGPDGRYMSGTSQATANHTGRIISEFFSNQKAKH